MKKFDVIVIGAGPGGYVAAIRASQLGLKTAVVEKEYWGGVCLNVGCIPSKSLLKNAELAHILRDRAKEFGISFDNLKLDYSEAVKRSRQVSGRLVKGIEFLMKKNNIETFDGTAKLISKSQVEVTTREGVETLEAKDIIIATGAQVLQIPGMDIDGEQVVSYKEAILQEKLPQSVLIIGAGAIGLEFSTIWSSYGVDVTIVEMLPRIAPNEDPEVSAELAKEFKRKKINMLTSTKVAKIEKLKTRVKVTVESEKGSDIIEVEQVLMAAGFRPNSANLGLEASGVELGKRGEIIVDDKMATNVPGIWAIGDVTAKLMLAHVASAMAIKCAENIAGKETTPINYTMVPKATYSNPQIASFGFTEEQAVEKGHEIKVGRFTFQPNGKALGLGERNGWIKIVADAKYGELLGAHMIGPEVTELLPELTLAQMNELTTKEIAANIHAHPSLSEVVMEAAHAVEGEAIHG
ncbi:MAG: dihydrolipoyl dehydrogenase [Anaerolineales bacterium]|nr:dihydrolipoyl dehydrogenase [Anaerolineales bacterium]